jgi:hypothetical protein
VRIERRATLWRAIAIAVALALVLQPNLSPQQPTAAQAAELATRNAAMNAANAAIVPSSGGGSAGLSFETTHATAFMDVVDAQHSLNLSGATTSYAEALAAPDLNLTHN